VHGSVNGSCNPVYGRESRVPEEVEILPPPQTERRPNVFQSDREEYPSLRGGLSFVNYPTFSY